MERVSSPTLSLQARDQLEEIQDTVQGRDWNENINDKWSYKWGNNKFSSKKAYTAMTAESDAYPLFT